MARDPVRPDGTVAWSSAWGAPPAEPKEALPSPEPLLALAGRARALRAQIQATWPRGWPRVAALLGLRAAIESIERSAYQVAAMRRPHAG